MNTVIYAMEPLKKLFLQLPGFFFTKIISPSSCRKGQCLITIVLLFNVQAAYALLPVDPTIVHGGAIIDTVGNHMTVTSDPNTVLDWQSFSIGTNDSVEFLMQNTSDQILNRVTGSNPSQILGELTSNGNVWLINPQGILFGQNAQIDVGSFVASTLEITNTDFLAKRYHFNASNDVPGNVLNQGEIRTSLGGRVWLAGNQVSNEGLIESPDGAIVMATGKSLDLIDSSVPNVVVRIELPENEVSNLGHLIAPNGVVDVYSSIVNQDGIIDVNEIGTDASGRVYLVASDSVVHSESATTQGKDINILSGHDISLSGDVNVSDMHTNGGHIRVDGKDSVILSASLAANGGTQGGRIEITGGSIEIQGAEISATGGDQGGAVNLGGWSGNDDLTRASHILIDQDSVITATGEIKGGKIAVTSTQSTEFWGTLKAENGGNVELASTGDLIHQGTILTGSGGHVLLGARNFFITCGCTPVPEEYSLLFNTVIEEQLGNSSFVTVKASGVILVDAPIFYEADNNSTKVGQLNLEAGDDIHLQAAIDLHGQNLSLTASDAVTINEAISTNGEQLVVLAGRDILVDADINTDGGNLYSLAGKPDSIDTIRPVLKINEGHSFEVGSGTAILGALNGDFINENEDSAILTNGSGRWLIYSAHPDSTLEGFSTFVDGVQQYNKHYSQHYTGFIPSYASQGNWFLYSVEPFLQVTPDDVTITYGESLATIESTVSDSGLIDNDTLDDAKITGNAEWNVGGTQSTSGNPTAGVHDLSYARGLVSALGYQFEDNAQSLDELTVNQAPLILTDLTISNKTYDTTRQVSLSPGSEVFDGLVANDNVVISQLDAIFEDPNAGSDKRVTISSAGISGVDAMNYSFDGAVSMIKQASISPVELILQADPIKSSPGLPGLKLTGSADGFLGDDTLANATSGSLKWTTTATKNSPEGTYAILGGGLTAVNYQIIQAPGNSSALTIDSLHGPIPPEKGPPEDRGPTDIITSMSEPTPTSRQPPIGVIDATPKVWEIFIKDDGWRIFHTLAQKLEESGQMAYAILLAKLSVNAIHRKSSSSNLLEKIKAHEFLIRLLLEQRRYIEARFDALPMLKKLEYTYFINNEYEESFPALIPYNQVELKYANIIYDYILEVITNYEDDWFDEYARDTKEKQYAFEAVESQVQFRNRFIKLAANHLYKSIMDDSGSGILIAGNQTTQRGQSLFDSTLDLGAESSDDIQFQVDSIMARIHIDEIGHIDDIEDELKNSGHFLNEIERRGRVQEGLRKLERNLNEKTVLLFYILFDEKLTLLLYSANAFLPDMILDVSLNRTELNNQVARYRQKLINPHSNEYLISSEFLFNSLVAPISSRLKELKPDTLAIYKTGSLRYLPFSTLYDGNKYLIEDYAITTYFEAELAYLERPGDNWSIAGFGVSESILGDLPAVVDELSKIVLDASNDGNEFKHEAGILQGRKFLNEAFTSEILQDAIADEDLSILHFASHFALGNNYEDSYLLAGDGVKITLKAFRNFQMIGKQLVTLSACETALDNALITANDGREVEGLGFTVFTKNNARSVLATLWKVADQSTADFMVEFYRLIKQNKFSKVEAIRQAQMGFIKGVDSDGEDIGSRFQHPYYWAPFILMGNWL